MTRGRTILLAGPDGSGKTTVARALAAELSARTDGTVETLLVHHRRGAGVLPARNRRDTSAGTAETAGAPARPRPDGAALSTAKVLYVWADMQLGFLLRLGPALRRGGWVVAQRGWWDLAVDPQRYRLSHVGGLVAALGRLMPRPDLVVLLDAAPEAVAARKGELTADETARQLRAWRRVLPRRQRTVVVDTSGGVEPALDTLRVALARLEAGEPEDELPTGSSRRRGLEARRGW